ncbi:redoxin domain-containing protein [Brevibacillus sp. LEMMJ03]|uniref:TlpA family protein disulfide reductase n=1 Tax=Brevibacillus sp. LEMMJ03 TaxID=2595056 RepID=UPI00117F3927|nr:redoxin family protein [Brevibacillus sp. LEMMJ03]TRY23344.1 redoxin domain-containing protein [Brevibacillus sp. LEMMJ03]
MNNFLIISNIALWVIVIVQLMIIYFFSKILIEFLNRFRLSGKRLEEATLAVGDKAPLFRERDQVGKVVNLSDNFGKKAVILFLSETCDSCKDIFSNLSIIQLKNPNQKIYVIVSNYSKGKQYDIPDQISLIRSDNIVKQYLIKTVPTMVIVDEQGYISYADAVNSHEQIIAVLRVNSQQVS